MYDRLRPWVKPLLVFALLVSGGSASAGQDDAIERARGFERTLERLTRRWMEGDSAGVLGVVQDSLAGQVLTPRLRNLEGLALAELGRHQEAVKAYETGLGLHLGLPELHLNLAISLEALGSTGRAMAEFDEAARLDPESVEARLGLGRALLRFRRFDRAGLELDQVARMSPDDARVVAARAELAEATGDLEQARAAWTWLEERTPDARSARRLAELTDPADPAARLQWYRVAQQRDPADLESASAAAALALQLGFLAESAELLAPVVAAGAATDADLHNLLLARRGLGDPAGIERLVAEHPPGWGASWGVVALTRREAGDAKGALEAIGRAAEVAPDDLDLANLRAVCLDDLGRGAEAIALWEWILARDPAHPEAKGNLASRRP